MPSIPPEAVSLGPEALPGNERKDKRTAASNGANSCPKLHLPRLPLPAHLSHRAVVSVRYVDGSERAATSPLAGKMSVRIPACSTGLRSQFQVSIQDDIDFENL